jgi:Chaperone of endosialidase
MSSTINATTTSGVAITGDTSGNLAIQTNNGTTAVFVDTSQNVGVGTSTPTTKFSVSGTSSFMSGSVGIGTTTPAQQLEISSANEAIQAITSTGTNGRQYNLISTGGTTGLSQGAFSIYDRTASLSRIFIDSSGKVMVNATTLTAGNARLYVQSTTEDIYLGVNGVTKEFAVSNVGQIYAQFTSITSLSDRRAKENIEPIKYGLEEVNKLNPVTFNFIAHPELEPTYGFIAQEVQPVLPELVGEEKDNKAEDGTPYLTLKMGDMLPVLVKAVQELKALVDTQAQEIAALQAKVGGA